MIPSLSSKPIALPYQNKSVRAGHYSILANPVFVKDSSGAYTGEYAPTISAAGSIESNPYLLEVMDKSQNTVDVSFSTPLPMKNITVQYDGLPSGKTYLAQLTVSNADNSFHESKTLKSGETLPLPQKGTFSIQSKPVITADGSYITKTVQVTDPAKAVTLHFQKVTAKLVGYLDATSIGEAENALGMGSPTSTPTKLIDMCKKGYHTIIWGFAQVTGDKVSFYTGTDQLVHTVINYVNQHKDQFPDLAQIITVGGQNNTFSPDQGKDPASLAQNIVSFLKANNLQGIDFDLECNIDAAYLDKLLTDIHHDDANVLVSAAPQLNGVSSATDVQLVTTGTQTSYNQSLEDGLFNAIYVQAYNTGRATNVISGYDETQTQYINAAYHYLANLTCLSEKRT